MNVLKIFGISMLGAISVLFLQNSYAADDGFRTAFDACSKKYSRPSPGQEPSSEFKACMKAAGFDGPPKGGRPNGPPPASAPQNDENSGSSSGGQ